MTPFFKTFLKTFLLCCLGFIPSSRAYCQLSFGLVDAMNTEEGHEFQKMVQERPQEVMFGVYIRENGDVYFGMNNKAWLNKIFSSDSYGISVDVISKDRYACDKPMPDTTKLQHGILLKPLYTSDLFQNLKEVQEGAYIVKVGTLNPKVLKTQLEGNLLFVRDNQVLHYIKFINIDRTVWHILPMGLFTDTLVQLPDTASLSRKILFSRSAQITIPFPRAQAVFNEKDVAPLYEALKLKEYSIREIEIRAYSSVEGSEKLNDSLMQKRAEAMMLAINRVQPGIKEVKIRTAENWIEFFRDIESGKFSNLASLSKAEIKARLNDKTLFTQMEPILATERKAVVTVYLDKKTMLSVLPDSSILNRFNQAVQKKDILSARTIQKEVASRIMDNRLPASYLNKLEIPASKEYSSLLNDKLAYSYMFHNTSEYEALKECLDLQKLDPSNSKVSYNICALRLIIWENGIEPADPKILLQDIGDLGKRGIDASLVKRMQINFHILQSAYFMTKGQYEQKDESLRIIKASYGGLKLNDQELFSLGRYFSYYVRYDWAKQLIAPRIDQLDVSEDLVFFYVNLEFTSHDGFSSELFKKAILNAINLNRARFCKFFTPADKGGASFQLLEFKELKKAYCQYCNP